VLALIPARGGSKGIPRKNLAVVGGETLLARAIESAAAPQIDRVVVSTDDDEIAAAAAELGAETITRASELAADETPMLDVIVDAAERLHVDALVLLQPTSPLRTVRHVGEAVELFRSSGADAVVSVVEVPHQFRPDKLVRIESGRVVAEGDAPLHRNTEPVYARNGPAVLVLRTDGLAARGLYGGDVRAYLMDPAASLDVDAPGDLLLAEALLAR
jgi:CMP-N-acetylneuraminic acid synthetase